MNKQMKNVLWVGIIILLFSACGQLETAPAPADMPELIVTVKEDQTNTPEPIVTPGPVENSPTAVLANGSDPEKFSKYIGLSYPPLPAGLSEELSMIIQDSNVYGLSLVSDADSRMLWLSKLTHNDSSGNAYWEIKDVLELSNLESGAILIPDGCLLNGEVDNEIFVVGKNEKILLAWRANTTLNVFEVIPTNGIECHSDKGVILE